MYVFTSDVFPYIILNLTFWFEFIVNMLIHRREKMFQLIRVNDLVLDYPFKALCVCNSCVYLHACVYVYIYIIHVRICLCLSMCMDLCVCICLYMFFLFYIFSTNWVCYWNLTLNSRWWSVCSSVQLIQQSDSRTVRVGLVVSVSASLPAGSYQRPS